MEEREGRDCHNNVEELFGTDYDEEEAEDGEIR